MSAELEVSNQTLSSSGEGIRAIAAAMDRGDVPLIVILFITHDRVLDPVGDGRVTAKIIAQAKGEPSPATSLNFETMHEALGDTHRALNQSRDLCALSYLGPSNKERA